MDPEMIMIIAVVAIGCATGLISSWMKKHYRETEIDEENFNQLAKAFIQHKKDMLRRVQNLEEIIVQENDKDDISQIEAPKEDRTLKNDLQEKNKVRS